MATHPSIVSWRNPRTEELGGPVYGVVGSNMTAHAHRCSYMQGFLGGLACSVSESVKFAFPVLMEFKVSPNVQAGVSFLGFQSPSLESLPWPQQGRMVEVKRASLIPIKGMMGIPYPAVKRGFSAVNMPLASG